MPPLGQLSAIATVASCDRTHSTASNGLIATDKSIDDRGLLEPATAKFKGFSYLLDTCGDVRARAAGVLIVGRRSGSNLLYVIAAPAWCWALVIS